MTRKLVRTKAARWYLYAATITLALTVLLFSQFDVKNDLSYKLWYFDSIEHFLGGVAVGFFALVLAEVVQIRTHRVVFVLVTTLVVGLGWESLEFILGLTDGPFVAYEIDTVKDLVLDVLGAYAAVRLGHLMHVRYV